MLDGMRDALSRRAVDVLELELGGARWAGTTVKATLAWLSSLGYGCVWQAVSCLVPMSGRCYHDAYDTPKLGGGNIVCAHGQALEGLHAQVRYCPMGGG